MLNGSAIFIVGKIFSLKGFFFLAVSNYLHYDMKNYFFFNSLKLAKIKRMHTNVQYKLDKSNKII